MAVLTNIPNNTSARDWRDTVNALIKRIAALEAAGVPVETPAPVFTTQPSISPTSGTAGSTVYAATPGTVSNGSVVSRAWLLNGVAISNGVTAVPASSGTLTYQETASGPGGTTTSTVQVAAVTAAATTPTPAPAFTSQPSISPASGTAGTTTFTATAGNVSNGSVTSRSWTINGTVISTGLTASPASSGTLTYQETATGSGGTVQSTVQQVTVATAAAPAPAFTTQPTVSPSTGTAGTTTYTATPGAVSNGTITSRAWSLNGSVISTGLTAAPVSAGTLTYQEFATGSGGSAQSSILTRTVSAATSAPSPTLSLSSAVAKAEGNSGTTVFSWTLTLNRDGSTEAYPFNWSTAGSGTNPANAADFGGTFPTGSGTFAPGETSKTISVLVAGDTAIEPDDTFTLTVSASGLNTVTSTGTISNDDVVAFAGWDVFLLAGQSNMESRYGPVDATLDATDDRIMQYGYDSQTVTLASDPLDARDETANTVGMGMTIAKQYIADGKLAAGRKILLVPVAQGNTAFVTGFWRAAGSGDTQAIARANAAMALSGGTNQFIGTAWHQGEGDRSSSQATYSADLDALIARWRSSITGAANSPFIVGGLLVGGSQTTTAISAALADLPNRVAFTAFVDSTGLTSGGDNLHFDAASQRTFGARYYAALATAKANVGTPKVGISAAQSKSEGNSGATLFTYTVTRTATTGAVSVPWTFAAGSTAADDFTSGTYPAGGTVDMANGVATGTFSISVNGDTTVEPDETFTVSITAPNGYTLASNTSATGTIVNDDAAAGGLNATYFGADGTSMSGYISESGHTATQTVGVSQIIGNAMTPTTVPSEGTFNWIPPSINQTIRWQTIVGTKTGNHYRRYRVVDAANYYYAGLGSNGAFHTLASWVNSQANNFAGATTATPAVSPGDVLDYELVITGTAGAEIHTLKVSVNGGAAVQVFSAAPSVAAQGTPDGSTPGALRGVGLIGWRQSSATATATTGCRENSVSATAA